MVKKIISIGLLAAMLLYGSFSEAMPKVKINKKIPPGSVMKSIARPVIQLYDNTIGSLELLFYTKLGGVAVTVEGEAGVVYQDTWQVTAGEQRSISTEDWESGMYTLTIAASSGAVYTWDFELVED